MKTIQLLSIIIFAMGMTISCTGQTNDNKQAANSTSVKQVEVYYFHFTRRCETCNAVESVSKEAIASLYGDKVSFAEYNLDEKAGELKGKEVGVSGQTLLIVSGATQINITNEGFMNARSNPDKLKQIIKEKIDPLL